VRLRYAYLITCKDVVKNAAGEVTALVCAYDPATRGGDAPDGRKVKSTLHWVAAAGAAPLEARLYDRLFTAENPHAAADWLGCLNPASMEIVADARGEPSLADVRPGACVQFERLGYFAADPDGAPGRPVFNRAVTLKDAWAKAAKT
jgi:glutaminyl-tRNA synthetase